MVRIRNVRQGKPQNRAGARGRLRVVPRAARALQTLRAGAHAEQAQPRATDLTFLHLREGVEDVLNLIGADANS